MIEVLKCKLHCVKATGADKDYEGSIIIDQAWMDMAGLVEYEKVHVWNRTNGSRHVTYAISAPAGSGQIISNGPAAFLVSKGDVLVIAAFRLMEEAKASYHKPRILLFDDNQQARLKPND